MIFLLLSERSGNRSLFTFFLCLSNLPTSCCELKKFHLTRSKKNQRFLAVFQDFSATLTKRVVSSWICLLFLQMITVICNVLFSFLSLEISTEKISTFFKNSSLIAYYSVREISREISIYKRETNFIRNCLDFSNSTQIWNFFSLFAKHWSLLICNFNSNETNFKTFFHFHRRFSDFFFIFLNVCERVVRELGKFSNFHTRSSWNCESKIIRQPCFMIGKEQIIFIFFLYYSRKIESKIFMREK